MRAASALCAAAVVCATASTASAQSCATLWSEAGLTNLELPNCGVPCSGEVLGEYIIPSSIGTVTLATNTDCTAAAARIDVSNAVEDVTGTLPDTLGNVGFPFELHVEGNAITGGIPAAAKSNTNFVGLYADNNNLSGELDDILSGWHAELTVLDLNGNTGVTGSYASEALEAFLSSREKLRRFGATLAASGDNGCLDLNKVLEARLANGYGALSVELPAEGYCDVAPPPSVSTLTPVATPTEAPSGPPTFAPTGEQTPRPTYFPSAAPSTRPSVTAPTQTPTKPGRRTLAPTSDAARRTGWAAVLALVARVALM